MSESIESYRNVVVAIGHKFKDGKVLAFESHDQVISTCLH